MLLSHFLNHRFHQLVNKVQEYRIPIFGTLTIFNTHHLSLRNQQLC